MFITEKPVPTLESMNEKILILETSQRVGAIALALGDTILGERRLEEARRHTRDLVPFCRDLLNEQGWKARELDAVIVSRGPGSYTGLRVGIMSAKTLAYATGCALIGIDTFAALAHQVLPPVHLVEVIEDAQQSKVYAQRFVRDADAWKPANDLHIASFDEWLAQLPTDAWVTGPGLTAFQVRLPSVERIVSSHFWRPHAHCLLHLGLRRLRAGERDDVMALEPLYLRASQAEQQWKK